MLTFENSVKFVCICVWNAHVTPMKAQILQNLKFILQTSFYGLHI